MLQTLHQYHQVLETEKFKAVTQKFLFMLKSVKIRGHQTKNHYIYSLKSKIDGFFKL